METIDAGSSLAVTLTAAQWQQVLVALNEAPYRLAAPLIDAIVKQAQAGAGQAQMEGRAGEPRLNGQDAHA